ncbi:hypothetical protein FLAN108750_10595 [Flavobacterium antarcticum]|uniref:hypothetical protein n=1 Tax=Flavobacterium antarcticum TaxID=271155 RepID=UPI0003B6E0F0|nr:hypothetical protein [Flavobacterium antarcticum]
MKLLFIIVSLTLLLKPVFPVLEYFFNYDYIVKELCENKAKPELNCNGKCHLVKELASASNSDATNSTDKKVVAQQYEVVYFQEIESITFRFLNANFTPEVLNSYTDNYFHLGIDFTFHPPIL